MQLSTKSSFFYKSKENNNYLHFYADVAEPEVYFLDKVITSEVNYRFTIDELALMAKAINLVELERQANITDEQIENYVKADIVKILNSKNSWSIFCTVYGSESDPLEKRIECGINYFINKRKELKSLHERISTQKVMKISFGLESII
jgi:hypothetical protein